MFKLNAINFLKFCVDMSDLNQGQPIDPSRLIFGRLVMTNNARRARITHISQKGEEVKVGWGMLQKVLRLHSLKSHK